MNLSPEPEAISATAVGTASRNPRLFAWAVGCLSILFIKPLFDLVNYGFQNDLYSHVLFIPCVSFYLLWQKKKDKKDAPLAAVSKPRQTSPRAAFVAFALGFAALAFYWFSFKKSSEFNLNDYLTLTIFAFVCWLIGSYLFFLGKNVFSSDGFPVAFLLFMVPFPLIVTDFIEMFFQHASAYAAHGMLLLANAHVFRTGLQLHLPGITLAVAPECSGIRSTLVLLITSVIAGHMFLRSPWKKLILTCFVIPLAILRNGFRIFTIAELCIHIGPEMIDSPIHHKGGPIFFALSLIPFFILLIFLQKSKWLEKPATGLNQGKL